MQWTEKECTGSICFLYRNFPTHLRFHFCSYWSQTFVVRRKCFASINAIFFCDWVFGGKGNDLGNCYTKMGWMAQKKIHKSVWWAFDIWQGHFLGLKNYWRQKFLTRCSFLLRDETLSREIAAHLVDPWSSQNKQCAVFHLWFSFPHSTPNKTRLRTYFWAVLYQQI